MTRPDAAPDAAGDDVLREHALVILAASAPDGQRHALDAFHAHAVVGCIRDLATEVRRLRTADLARLRATPELAAIGARHQERLALPLYVVAGPHVEGDRRTLSPLPPTQLDADIGTLLAHIAAQQAAHAAALDGRRAEALREAADVAREEAALWADALDGGSEVAIARHQTASDIAAAVAALAAPRGR